MLLAVGKTLGLESDCIPHVATGLGGGIGRQGEVCGALNGGALLVGLTFRRRAGDNETKNLIYSKTGEFVRHFDEANGAVLCRELIGLDLTSEKGLKDYHAQNKREEKCNEVVKNAVQAILEVLDN
jgi:C_GCAxxG_C_C family probable redox protein